MELADRQATARRLAEERDALRVSEAKEFSLASERGEELQLCKDAVEQMKLKNKEQLAWVSSQEEELQRCRDVIHQLKSEGSEHDYGKISDGKTTGRGAGAVSFRSRPATGD
eukprot:s35_g39.t1